MISSFVWPGRQSHWGKKITFFVSFLALPPSKVPSQTEASPDPFPNGTRNSSLAPVFFDDFGIYSVAIDR